MNSDYVFLRCNPLTSRSNLFIVHLFSSPTEFEKHLVYSFKRNNGCLVDDDASTASRDLNRI